MSQNGAVEIRLAARADAALLNAALRSLSNDLGDTHRATDGAIGAAGFGVSPAFRALLAEAGGEVVGVALFSPLYSTTRGMAGAYVSDLWVDETMRGQGLGRRLMGEVHMVANRLWGAGFLRLAVHDANPRARAFYDSLGFQQTEGETSLTLTGAPLAALAGNEPPRRAQTGDHDA